jgi:hypothetical protein
MNTYRIFLKYQTGTCIDVNADEVVCDRKRFYFNVKDENGNKTVAATMFVDDVLLLCDKKYYEGFVSINATPKIQTSGYGFSGCDVPKEPIIGETDE